MGLRLRVSVWLLRLVCRINGAEAEYWVVPRSRLPVWVDEYICYLEQTDYQDADAYGGRENGRAQSS